MTTVKRVFMVDGKPFFPLGGQSGTSSAYNDSESETSLQGGQAAPRQYPLDPMSTGTRSNPKKANLTLPAWTPCSPTHADMGSS